MRKLSIRDNKTQTSVTVRSATNRELNQYRIVRYKSENEAEIQQHLTTKTIFKIKYLV